MAYSAPMRLASFVPLRAPRRPRAPARPLGALTPGLGLLLAFSPLAPAAGAAPASQGAEPPPAAVAAPRGPLTLERAVSLALARNERAAAARARTEAADARLARARAVFWPDVTLTGNYTHQIFEPETSGLAAQFGRGQQSQDVVTGVAALSATLFDFRAYPLLRQARHAREAAHLTEGEDRRALAFEAAQAFVATLGAEQVVAAAERRRALSTQSLGEAKARAEARLASVHDATRAELELRTAESALTQARVAAEQARLALATLLGLDDALAVGTLGAPSPAAPQASAADIEAHRRDLEARRELLAAQTESANEPGRRFVPTLRFDARYQLSSQEGMGGRNDDATVGLTLTWPVFDGFERDAEADERRASAREQSANLALAARTVTRDVRMAEAALRSQQALVESARAAADAATRNANEASALYAQGLSQAFEVADAQARQFEAEVARTRADLGEVAARLQLAFALGRWPTGPDAPAQSATP